ncbi:MAG: HgcAB-associated protein [Candidatus Aminicenantales bacterium]
MSRGNKKTLCGVSPSSGLSCCKVESLLSVDERGQMVLPKDARDRAGIKAGDKVALVSWEKEGKVCCFTLLKVEELTEFVKNKLGPVMKEIFKE